MAEILRDRYGVPHVRASDILDLARGQGEATAHDRSWQLEWLRRRATGTTAELVGAPAVSWDVLARRVCLAAAARRATAALGEESRAFVAAYVAGLNAGLRDDVDELRQLGVRAQPWPEWMPAAVFLAQHLLFGRFPGKLWDQHAREVLGADAALLSVEGPSGSNAWAVGGARTASGFPLLAADPHRILESPGVYQQVRLQCDEFDVLGLAFPGVPGVPHFGHAGEVAWAVTNGCGDYQDVYAERLTADAVASASEETVRVRGGRPVTVEVLETDRGPLFEVDRAAGTGLSLRQASFVLADVGFGALLPLLRARTVDDVDRALDHWVEPVNNVVIADHRGSVRYRLAGRVPLRPPGNRRGIVDADDPGTAWTGWLEPLPRTDISATGQVVTANERRGPESEAVGAVFAAPYRAQRITDLLDMRDGLTADDFVVMQNDTFLEPARLLRDLLPAELKDWDARMEASSPLAGAYAAWRAALVRRIAAAPALAPLAALGPGLGHSPVFAPYVDLTTHVALALPTIVAAGSPFGLDLEELAADAWREVAGRTGTWGDVHRLTTLHAFEQADPTLGLRAPEIPAPSVDGDQDCVRCTGSIPAVIDECYRGSVARLVWDLADREASAWVVPLGASGDPDDFHHLDQLPLWAEGSLAPVW